jgi:hypothetical protein
MESITLIDRTARLGSNSEPTDAAAICGGSPAQTTSPLRARQLPRWYLPGVAAVFNKTGYACNESSSENGNQYPCGFVHFRGVSDTDIMHSRQLS